jgi:hypothetical protein
VATQGPTPSLNVDRPDVPDQNHQVRHPGIDETDALLTLSKLNPSLLLQSLSCSKIDLRNPVCQPRGNCPRIGVEAETLGIADSEFQRETHAAQRGVAT